MSLLGPGVETTSTGDAFTQVGNMAHELGHILGMSHEQQRPDGPENFYGSLTRQMVLIFSSQLCQKGEKTKRSEDRFTKLKELEE